jgi:polysaccharide deacetylase family protein (PEP-CTERM system associated)
MAITTDAPRHALTVDVEDWFHADALAALVPHSRWPLIQPRIERSIDVVLALLDQHGVKATFFTLGWIARRHPALVKAIAACGHELASHGYTHQGANGQTRTQFRRDIIRSKGLIEDLAGVQVAGYRAPALSVGPQHRWALDALFNAGYRYSSSSYPALFGAAAQRHPCYPAGPSGILELPLSTVRIGPCNLPSGGGSAFRMLPCGLARALLRRAARQSGQPCIFRFNAWELDPGQPREAGLAGAARLRHYAGIGAMEARLLALTRDFWWGRIDTVFQVGPGVPGHLFHRQPRPRWHACLGAETAIPHVRSRS